LGRIFCITKNFNLAKGNGRANSRSQGLCHSLLGGESGGKGWVRISKLKGVGYFIFGEDTPQKPVPAAAVNGSDAGDLDDIRANSDNFAHGLFLDGI
jgi:hypothetical protein